MSTQFSPGTRVRRGGLRATVRRISRGADLIEVLRDDLHATYWDEAARWEREDVPEVGSRDWLEQRAMAALMVRD